MGDDAALYDLAYGGGTAGGGLLGGLDLGLYSQELPIWEGLCFLISMDKALLTT
jgi:hypothetical protein